MSTKVDIAVVGSSVSKNINKTFKPEFIYIPLEDKNKIVYESIVKNNEYIYKGQIIGINKKNNLKVYSSVSGYVIGTEKHLIETGKRVNTIIIENDYKEKTNRQNIDLFNKKVFINTLKETSIITLEEYNNIIKNNIKYLIVNAVEDELLIANTTAFYYYNIDNILEKIDSIMEIMNIEKSIIVIKKTNTNLINNINKYIGTYPNIKVALTDKYYSSSNNKNIVKKILKVAYKKSPIEKGILLFNINDIILIIEMINHKCLFTEKVITISNKFIKSKIKVKIGSLASDIIKYLDHYKEIKNPLFIAGNLIKGKSLPNDDLIITKDINTILLIEDKKENQRNCINCGKCINICPEKIMPVFIINNIDNIDNLKKLNPNKCTECGLCSYICPSKIPIKEIIIDSKERIKSK